MITPDGRAKHRIWRTADGRFVGDGHTDARVLAYGPGDEIAAKDIEQLTPTGTAAPVAKQAPKPADKSIRFGSG